MPKQTISTFNGLTQTPGAGFSLIISTNSLSTIQSIYGYINGNATPGAAQYWLQLFNQATVPSNATVPLASLQVLSSDGFQFDWTEWGLQTENLTKLITTSGWIICLSTTEATLTLGTGNVTMDCSVDIDAGIIPIFNAVSTGRIAGNCSVWTEADGAVNNHLLLSAFIENGEATARYVGVFLDDGTGLNGNTSVFAGNIPIFVLPASQNITLNFGRGINPSGCDRTYVQRYGCRILVFNNLPVFDNGFIPPKFATQVVVNVVHITAYYK